VVETAENFRARAGAIPSAWPLEGVLTSGFGWRRSPFNRRWKFHFGIDVSAPVGTIIRAPASGVVVTAEYNSGYGRMLEVDHGYEVVTRYAHNARLLVGVGEVVQAGQPISTVGMTGATTGPHLHYEIYVEGQPIDPLEHLQ
jgi:murein DD-endopeptidase MepM/ murein hydrolase activator NlpD